MATAHEVGHDQEFVPNQEEGIPMGLVSSKELPAAEDKPAPSHAQEGSSATAASGDSTAVDSSPQKAEDPDADLVAAEEGDKGTDESKQTATQMAGAETGDAVPAAPPSEDADGQEWEKVEKPTSPEKSPPPQAQKGVKAVAGGVKKVLKSGVFGGE
jgi:hypothetical protein